MRAVVFSCLLACVLISSSFITTADADTEELSYCRVDVSGVSNCVSAYATTASGGGGICPALDEYIGCLGDLFSCNPFYASSWNSSLSAYRSVWDSYCTSITPITGVSDAGMVFGDPHYRLANGSYQTCNELGSNFLAVSKLYVVKVVHGGFGQSVNGYGGGAVVTEVSVDMFHVGAPAGTFVWTLGSSPTPVSKGGITVSADGIEGTSIGLNLKITRRSDHFVLGLVTKKLTGGILLKGCNDPVPSPSTVDITGPCAAVPKAFQGACLYDSERVNATWAVSASNTASAQEESITATAEGQNGAPSSVFAALSALLMVAVTLVVLVL